MSPASGVAFAEGLLRAAAVEQRSLHVEAPLGWLSDTNRPTAVRALALTMRAALVARLPKNQLRDADAAVLAATLRCADCTLLTLDLRGNAIGSSGGRSLGQALLANSTVTELRIDGDGTLPIDQLKGRTRVESLDLSVRGLGAASMAVVSALVARNRTLKDLSLLGNWSIGPEGGALMEPPRLSGHVLAEAPPRARSQRRARAARLARRKAQDGSGSATYCGSL